MKKNNNTNKRARKEEGGSEEGEAARKNVSTTSTTITNTEPLQLHFLCKTELGNNCTPSDTLFVPQSSRITVLCRDTVKDKGAIRIYKLDVDESQTGKSC